MPLIPFGQIHVVEGASIEAKDCANNTLLIWADRNNHKKFVDVLITAGEQGLHSSPFV